MRRANYLGLVTAVLFFVASMSPSLIPRPWPFQSLVSGIVMAAGYGLGTAASYLWRRLPIPEPPARTKEWAWRVLGVGAPAAMLVATLAGVGAQRQLRGLMAMPIVEAWGYLAAPFLGLVLAVALVGAGRAVRALSRRAGHGLARWLPRPVARVLGTALVVALLIGILDGIVINALFSAADETFRLTDEAVAEDLAPPGSPLRSGSPESLADWDDLGSKGRTFVAGGPTVSELEAFSGGPAEEPIRTYAGLASAEDVHDRAQLVLDELIRTDAFERSVVCVMTATGTGWIDPPAAAALEYLWSGDTAIATLQYSYLPSWISFLVDSVRAREAGQVLFDTIYEFWATLPENDRPLLLVFGESLGADGSEAAFSGVADIRNRTSGVLWVGPPNFSELWGSFTANRDPGTSELLPVFEGGETVRFAASPFDLQAPFADWPSPRAVYLQHPSDPVVWWSPRLILRQPDWMREPPGDDVLADVRWYPLVTFWQISADMAYAKKVPSGHGHNYGGLFVDGWAAIASPPGWTQADTNRLHDLIAAQADAAVTD